jgi:FkbM family methyltransferase
MQEIKSPEEALEAVREAYQWILGRDADSSGLDHYGSAVARGELSLAELRRILIGSPEFGSKQVHHHVIDMGGGLKVVVDPDEPEFGRYIAASGIWEPHIVRSISTTLQPGDCFVDIGANVGVMSFHAAKAVGPDGKVIGFEPNPLNVSAFRRGIAANDFRNVILYPFALSNRREMIGVSSASNGKVLGEAVATQAADVIQAIPGDEILAHESRIDLIKIDIEGYELHAMLGLEGTISRHKPKILCEFNPLCLKGQGPDEVRRLADLIFGLTSSVQLIEHDGTRTDVHSTEDLLSLWVERDAYMTKAQLLPEGWVHFDLLFQVE